MSVPTTDRPEISEFFDLKLHHTFQLGATARYFATLHHTHQLPGLLEWARQQQLPVFILGGGSNLLPDQFIDGLVIRMASQGVQLLGDDANGFEIEAQAGERWHDFVMHTVHQQWYGLENLVLIPGTVGAAPVQNIGAYGVEVGQRIERLHVYDRLLRQSYYIQAGRCCFGYRDSIFKQQPQRWVILAVVFRLDRQPAPVVHYGDIQALSGPSPTALQVASAVMKIRQQKLPDPFAVPNAGSFFKNPVITPEHFSQLQQTCPDIPGHPLPDGRIKVPAGWLIDQCGWKGRRLGPVGMYEKQALVMVNHGQAALADVRQLTKTIQQQVFQRFSIELEPEPVVWETSSPDTTASNGSLPDAQPG